MESIKKISFFLIIVLLTTICTTGCTQIQGADIELSKDTQLNVQEKNFETEDYDTSIDKSATTICLNGTSATTDKDTVQIDGTVVSITNPGDYVLEGTLEDGQIIINSTGIVHLILNNASIINCDNAPIDIIKSDKTIITLQNGTENRVSDNGNQYKFDEEEKQEPDAAIFSKSDLTINGTGTLTVNANYQNGIKSKDNLKIADGNITVTAFNNGIVGRDSIQVESGEITVISGGDGIKTTNDEDSTKGNIIVYGGNFYITSEQDGIQSETELSIFDGIFNIVSGGGSSQAQPKENQYQGGEHGGFRGEKNIPKTDETPLNSNTSSESAAMSTQENQSAEDTNTTDSFKGIKSGTNLVTYNGDFTINAKDDALHTNGDCTIMGGDFTITTGDDGVHADGILTITEGLIEITESYEGLEGSNVTISGGSIRLKSSDDGINASGGSDLTSETSTMSMDSFHQTDTNHMITITGEIIYVNSNGDGIDSNGSINMTGGTLLIDGPTGNGNGAIDYEKEFICDGGILIGAGSAGMTQTPSNNSTQKIIAATLTKQYEAGTPVVISSSDGKILTAYTPAKSFQSIIFSIPNFTEKVNLSVGGTITGENINGYYSSANYILGNGKEISFALSDIITYVSEEGIIANPASNKSGGRRGMKELQNSQNTQ